MYFFSTFFSTFFRWNPILLVYWIYYILKNINSYIEKTQIDYWCGWSWNDDDHDGDDDYHNGDEDYHDGDDDYYDGDDDILVDTLVISAFNPMGKGCSVLNLLSSHISLQNDFFQNYWDLSKTISFFSKIILIRQKWFFSFPFLKMMSLMQYKSCN